MTNEYYINENGRQQGPFSFHELQQQPITLDTQVAKSPVGPWLAAADYPELAGYFYAKGVAVINEDDLASFWMRLGAFMIDLFVFFVLITTGNIIYTLNTGKNIEVADVKRNQYLIQIGGTLMLIVYNAIFEASPLQGSIGRMLMGLHVVDEDGQRLKTGQALLRNLGKIVSNLAFYLGYLYIFFNPYRQALHDRFAKTYVIRKPYLAK